MPESLLTETSVAPAETRSEIVQEFVDSRGVALQSDRSNGVLRGVKLLGLRSKNGRIYREAALRSAMCLYEGAKVNVNHPAGDPLAARDYRDRLGVIRNVCVKPGDGLFGDLHYNPKHALSEQLAWDAEHAPENVGLSHNVVARTTRQGTDLVVEAITRVRSVDLVADPATTSGLFEHETLPEVVADIDPKEQAATDSQPVLEELTAENGLLQEEVERLTEELNQVRRRGLIESLLDRHGLPRPETENAASLVTEPFLDDLFAAPDDATVEQLVAERSQLIAAASQHKVPERPESRESSLTPSSVSAPISFVEAITRR